MLYIFDNPIIDFTLRKESVAWNLEPGNLKNVGNRRPSSPDVVRHRRFRLV